MVIVVMAPLVVQLVKRIPVAWLIGLGFSILGWAMWYFASFNPATDYRHEALARVVQGLGIAFLFVPTSQLAFSYLPKNKTNKASSLTNLFRNQGGSFGIAFVTTVLERRTQFHRSVLASNITSSDLSLKSALEGLTAQFIRGGYSAADAALRARAQVEALLQQQSALLAFLDCFWWLGVIALAGPLLAMLIRRFRQDGGGAAH
jgi:DHA2 family multidrug resistance protein